MNPASRWRLAAGIPSLGLLLLAALTGVAAPRELWISPDGSDRNPGTQAQPLATLEAARDLVRRGKQAGPPPAGGCTVWIASGVYPRAATFELTEADSGSAEAPVLYCAAGPVVMRGGLPVRFGPLTNTSILARLSPVARGHVLEADLRAQGITEYGALVSRGFSRPTTPSHLELFYAARPMPLARWPNPGEWCRIAGIPADTARKDEHGGQLGDLQAGFLYEGDRPRQWREPDQVWVHGYWAWDWANSYERVASLDLDRHLVRTAPPHGIYGFRRGQRFYFLNVLEELDQPGEWYLDRGTGRLYFWPPDDTGRAEAVVSLLDGPLLSLRAVSHVALRGLTLEATRGTAVRIEGGISNRVEACLIRDVGNYGVWIEGGRGHVVRACDVEDCGDGGVGLAGGDRQTLDPAGHRAENCSFQRQGRWSKCYVPAILLNGVGLTAAHNRIRDHPHCAILFTGNDHLIEFNEIERIALETGDVGAIYTGRDWTYRGNRIRFNYVHDTGGVGMGSMGVYLDDCVSGAEIFGNVFARVARAAFLGGGRDHRVENNVFVDCHPAVAVDGRGLDRTPVWHDMVYVTMKRSLTAVPAAAYRARYPALADLDRYYAPEAPDSGIPPENNVVRRNVSAGGQWLDIGWHARPDWVTVADNVVTNDVAFVGIEPGRLSFRNEALVGGTGFQPIPFAQIGLVRDALRQSLPGGP